MPRMLPPPPMFLILPLLLHLQHQTGGVVGADSLQYSRIEGVGAGGQTVAGQRLQVLDQLQHVIEHLQG